MFIITDKYKKFIPGHCNLDGNSVKKTRAEYPYSYDAYVIWQNNYQKDKSQTVYSDRLKQWDWEKYNNCCETVWHNQGQYFDQRTPEDIEKFLCLYFDKQIKLTAITQGCNVSSGYPYWVFYYEELV